MFLNRALPALLTLGLVAGAQAQTVQFPSQFDQPNNVIAWTVNTSLGNVNVSPSTFRIGGTMEFKLDAAGAPFSLGQINGALGVTDPTALNGTIPNPIPFLPPLATFQINDMEFHLSSNSFTVDPLGNFAATIVLTSTAGTNTMGGLFGSGTESIAGIESLPTVVNGTVTQNGTQLVFHMDLNVVMTLVDPSTGMSTDLTFTGPLDAITDVLHAGSLHLDPPMPALAGMSNSFSFTNATPLSPAWLAGSLVGTGSTPVTQLGVTLGIAAPIQAGMTQADLLGNGSFNVVVPANLVGRSVWAQVVQVGRVSNVAGTWVM